MTMSDKSGSSGKVAAFLMFAAVLSTLVVFLYLATRNLHFPGLYYDEVIFVNAALGGINNDFVALRLFDVPVMIMPYIGALKSYLYFPVFKIFGVSPESIRIPVIMLSAGTLTFSFLLARRLFGTGLALLYLALVATDPAFIFNVRLDSGPVALMLFFKSCALFFFFSLLQTGSPRYVWLLLASLSLGLFDKLNFIWFVIALGIPALFFYGAELKELVIRERRRLVVPCSIFALVLGLAFVLIVIILLFLPGTMPDRTLQEKVLLVFNLYKGTMDGSLIYHFLTGVPFAARSWVHYLMAPVPVMFLMLLAGGRLAPQLLTRTQRRLPWFLLCVALLLSAQIIITREVGGAHHLMMLHPFHHLIFVSLLASLLALCKGAWQRDAFACCALGISLVVYSQLRADAAYASAFTAGASYNKRWDPRIYALAEHLSLEQADYIICTDWGIHTQLFCLATPERRLRYQDVWPQFKTMAALLPEQKQAVYDRFFKGKRVMAITHAPGAEIMPGTRENFRAFADSYGKGATLEKVVSNKKGEGLYELYRVNP